MLRYLILSLFTISCLEQAFAGGITIAADLDTDKVKTTRIRRDSTEDGQWAITGLSQCRVTYEPDHHRFVIKDLTYDFLRQKKERLNLIEHSDKIIFTLETKYTTYTTGHHEQEPTYRHSFTVTIPKGVDEDQTIVARLDRIMYCPPHMGGATHPKMQTLYPTADAL
jgi:hypothetical protein